MPRPERTPGYGEAEGAIVHLVVQAADDVLVGHKRCQPLVVTWNSSLHSELRELAAVARPPVHEVEKAESHSDEYEVE